MTDKQRGGKVAIVTGASKGIGRSIAARLAEAGYRVVVNYYASEGSAKETAAAIASAGGIAMTYRADVTNSAEVEAMVHNVLQQWGQIDVLVNNAGVLIDTITEDISDNEWVTMIAINLNSVFYICRAIIPYFKQRHDGRIINISSQAALTGSALPAHYAAAKAGVLGFSYSLAKELGPHGITVNIVSPGRIRTEMITSRDEGRMEQWMQQTPLKRLGEPNEVAEAVVFLASEQAAYITGLNMHVNGGLVMG